MDRHYNWAIIDKNSNCIQLFNNSVKEAAVLSNDFLKDVSVEIDNNGVLKIYANRIIYDLYFGEGRRIFEKDWRHEPHHSEIHEGKRWPWSKKERFVYNGWVKTAETEKIEYVMSKYKIEIYD